MQQLSSLQTYSTPRPDYYSNLPSPYSSAMLKDNHLLLDVQRKKLQALRQARSNPTTLNLHEPPSIKTMVVAKEHYPFGPFQSSQQMRQQSILESYCIQSPLQKINRKPKIIFSYHKQEKRQVDFQRFYGSKKDDKKDSSINHGEIKQFQLLIEAKHKKQKNRIEKNVMEFVNNPVSYNTKSNIQLSKSQQAFRQRSRPHESGSKKKAFVNASGLASTEATTSHLNEPHCDFNECHQQKASNRKLEFIYKSKRTSNNHHKKSLTDKLSPSKLLKKTIMLSKNNFGDIFKNTSIESGPRVMGDEGSGSLLVSTQKWINFARCLFEGEQNLKESIHCGPDIKVQEMSDVLVGFGRQIGCSSIQNID